MADNKTHPPRPFSEIGGRSLTDYALTALLVLESTILFVAVPVASMGFRVPLLVGGLLGVPLVLSIVVISSSTGARILAALATALD